MKAEFNTKNKTKHQKRIQPDSLKRLVGFGSHLDPQSQLVNVPSNEVNRMYIFSCQAAYLPSNI